MDAHTVYAADYIRQCVAVLEETGADNVGGPWVAKGQGYVARAIAAAFQSPFAVGEARGHDPSHKGPVDTVYLGCWRRGRTDGRKKVGDLSLERIAHRLCDFYKDILASWTGS